MFFCLLIVFLFTGFNVSRLSFSHHHIPPFPTIDCPSPILPLWPAHPIAHENGHYPKPLKMKLFKLMGDGPETQPYANNRKVSNILESRKEDIL